MLAAPLKIVQRLFVPSVSRSRRRPSLHPPVLRDAIPLRLHDIDGEHLHELSVDARGAISEVIWKVDNVELTTVGIDIGSSTSHLMFARVRLQRKTQALSSQFVVIDREILWRSPILLTPFLPDNSIDAERAGRVHRRRVPRRRGHSGHHRQRRSHPHRRGDSPEQCAGHRRPVRCTRGEVRLRECRPPPRMRARRTWFRRRCAVTGRAVHDPQHRRRRRHVEARVDPPWHDRGDVRDRCRWPAHRLRRRRGASCASTRRPGSPRVRWA